MSIAAIGFSGLDEDRPVKSTPEGAKQMASVSEPVRPLVTGDNLSRAEFLRLWEQHPEIKRAELLGGIVYMPSPVSVEHGSEEVKLGGLFLQYQAYTPGCE